MAAFWGSRKGTVASKELSLLYQLRFGLTQILGTACALSACADVGELEQGQVSAQGKPCPAGAPAREQSYPCDPVRLAAEQNGTLRLTFTDAKKGVAVIRGCSDSKPDEHEGLAIDPLAVVITDVPPLTQTGAYHTFPMTLSGRVSSSASRMVAFLYPGGGNWGSAPLVRDVRALVNLYMGTDKSNVIRVKPVHSGYVREIKLALER
jgi:hypothetical protein